MAAFGDAVEARQPWRNNTATQKAFGKTLSGKA
jgi:hypothetical protein